jgi:hypothetical protein
VFENRLLRRVFGSKRDEVRGEWRKLHNMELNDFYPSPNIVRVIKSRKMKWAVHVVRMGGVEVYTGFWWRNLRETDHLEDPDLWYDSNKMDVQEVGCLVWNGSSWLRIGTDGGHL